MKGRLAGTLAAVAVLAAIILGLYLAGPPEVQREKKLDARRIADLQVIASAVDFYYTRYGKLPDSLSILEKEPGSRLFLSDPLTGEAYPYTRFTAGSYRICARFARESGPGEARTVWAHGSGRYCFQLKARRLKNR
ncbi:MAG: hypothetical protein HGB20_06355 [Chlorobiaceae bacterium]|nr:hypothetical protein [Chlorobiaceae bacterium]